MFGRKKNQRSGKGGKEIEEDDILGIKSDKYILHGSENSNWN